MDKAKRMSNSATQTSTMDAAEIERFHKVADSWWDATGKFRPLHQINPVRIRFIRDHLIDRFGLDAGSKVPFDGLKLLDIGCGGGLLSEPMARLGAQVTAIDAGEKNIAAAKLHAEDAGLTIDYRHQLPEDLAKMADQFDVVLNMEVVEHVADLNLFLEAAGQLVRPGGAMVATTLNRTLKSLALAKIGAEYILRWLPAGTHDWRKFVTPGELTDGLRRAGLRVTDVQGMVYNPLADRWRLDAKDFDVNYLVFAVKD